jgi:hypothetical protein
MTADELKQVIDTVLQVRKPTRTGQVRAMIATPRAACTHKLCGIAVSAREISVEVALD